MIKVEAVLPKRLQAYQSLMFSPDFYLDSSEFQFLDPLRNAAQRREYVKLFYQDVKLAVTEREVRPLAIYFWRGTWTLLTWCELRADFRNFRVDRITGLLRLNRHFESISGQELEDYIRLMDEQAKACSSAKEKPLE
jgi:predicted DNA-binding transcriptional regulator YafY